MMKPLRPTLILVTLALVLCVSATSSADHYYRGGGYYNGYYRGGVDVFIDGSFWGPSWYYPMPYFPPYDYPYYYPAPVTVPSSPPVYIERNQSEDSYKLMDVWYYCPGSKSYYPYVKECPGGWQTVPTQPSLEPRR